MDEHIFQRLVPLVADKLNVDESEVTPGAAFVDDLGADSLAMVELAMILEDEFGIVLPDDEIDKIKTVDQAVTHISAKLG